MYNYTKIVIKGVILKRSVKKGVKIVTFET